MRKSNMKRSIAACLSLALLFGTMTDMGSLSKAASVNEGKEAAATATAVPSATPLNTVSGGAIGAATSTPSVSPSATPTDLSTYTPATPVATVRGGSKRIRVNWNQISTADGYYIYARPSTDAAYAKVAEVKDKTVVEKDITSLTQSTTYYVRVSAYRNVNGTIVESSLSATVSAKTASVSGTSKSAKKYSTKTKFKASPAYKTYKKFSSYLSYTRTFAIPGIKTTNVGGYACTTMVPQAMAYAGNYLLISAYDSKGVDYSVIYVVSKSSKSYITTIVLPSKAKVGGMAYDGTNIWISKGSSVAAFPYSTVTAAINSGAAYYNLASYKTICKMNGTASYMGYYNGTLWVGTFNASASNTMYGYSVANAATVPTLTPTYTMAMPSKTQGLTFTTDGTMLVSRSYRTKKAKSGYISQIRAYSPSYANASSTGKILKNSATAIKTMPPMIEGMAIYGSYTYTLYSSTHYSSCKYPVDRVVALKTSKLLG